MGQTIGTVQTQKISANEFSFEWHFCKVNFDLAYRSPTFGFTCKEFSGSYFEIKPNVIKRVLAFYLSGCKRERGSKISSNAILVDGKTIAFKSNEYEVCLDLESSMKVFEINLSDPMLSSCFEYIFVLNLKLHCYSTYLSSILNVNTSLQSERPDFTSINEASTNVKSLECTKSTTTTLNEVSTGIEYLEHKDNSSVVLNKESSQVKRLGYYRSSCITFNEKPTNAEYVENNKVTAFSEEKRSAPNLECTKELIEDLRCLYTSGNMCDLKIRIGEDVLHAHKLILSARSPVLKKMIEHDFIESSTNSVIITNYPTLPFKYFLKYLYTGEIEDGTMDTMMSLYSLGEKYNVKALPEACSDILQKKLSSEPVDDVANIICDVLQLAAFHGDKKLQDLSENFIINHFPVVSQKPNWKDLMRSNFELTTKILALVATGLQKVQT